MHFQYPIQRMRRLGGSNPDGRCLLAASAGQNIHIFHGATGSELFSWPSGSTASSRTPANGNTEHDASEPPEKRRKLSTSGLDSGEYPGAAQGSNPGMLETSAAMDIQWRTIPILVTTNAGSHVVAVTAEDKCVRVFEVTHDGKISQLSARPMPKRPSAISLAHDDSAILVTDKFGDVYSLPFFASDEPVPLSKGNTAEEPKAFQPSASQSTVHTKRNIVALEQQMRHGATISPKTGPTFERALLLGHVSMLTDVVFVSLPASPKSSASRGYILTSDRDEHIRISRGPPQGYIIEGYCLGHTSFVSRLCVPEWDRRLLISGGGDDYLLMWDWLQQRILRKVTLDELSGGQDWKVGLSAGEIAVAGIFDVPLGDGVGPRAGALGAIVIAVEGAAKLLSFVYDNNRHIVHVQPIELSGNVLDVTTVDRNGQILVALDNVHEPGSTKTRRCSSSAPQHFLQALKISDGPHGLRWEKVSSQAADIINEQGTTDVTTFDDQRQAAEPTQPLAESLYSLRLLRKKDAARNGSEG